MAEDNKQPEKTEEKPATPPTEPNPTPELDNAIESTVTGSKLTPDQLRKALSDVRSEAAAKRIEIKELKTLIESLKPKAELADKIPDLTNQLKDLQDQANAAKLEADKAKLEATKATLTAKYGLTPELAKLLDSVKVDELDNVAKTLSQTVTPKTGWKPAITGEGQKPISVAEQIFKRIGNRGVDLFDPTTHSEHGGGVYEDE